MKKRDYYSSSRPHSVLDGHRLAGTGDPELELVQFDHFLHMLGLKSAAQASAPAAALGFILSFMIPPFSEGSNFDSREAGIAGDAPLMWTNIHSGDIILDTKIRDWVRAEGIMIDVNREKGGE